MSEPTPVNILRGHKSQVHAAAFVRGNDRLATGDADGYVILWDLAIMRPKAVWRAHENAILAIRGWGNDKIITHGRDHRLVVWQLRLEDEQNLVSVSPLEQTGDSPPQPWMLHVLEVNTMNFCAFAACPSSPGANATLADDTSDGILVAVPNTLLAESIDIFELPSQKRIHTVKPGGKHGMAMTLAILHKQNHLILVAGFENGMCSVFVLAENMHEWVTTYRGQAHSQPVLSLEPGVGGEYFISSSADSLIVKHPIPTALQTTIPDFLQSTTQITASHGASSALKAPTGIGALFAGQQGSAKSGNAAVAKPGTKAWQDPIKVLNTKHSGQQSLNIRSDGRVFATAGWDSKIRVYATKSLNELAVLKWHQVGVYAAAFAGIRTELQETSASENMENSMQSLQAAHRNISEALISKPGGALGTHGMTVKERRLHHAKHTHWLVAGAKDGKLSLWDIY
ncbi:hypothetical protein PWT90_08673 [Aphanocladium album]|nr:hypothetical protein PWT90_08673 [Aphanocladium album]